MAHIPIRQVVHRNRGSSPVHASEKCNSSSISSPTNSISMTKHKGSSKLQRAQFMGNLAVIKAHKKDDSALAGTSPDTPALLSSTLLDAYKADLEAERDCSKDYERRYRNMKKQLGRSVAAKDTALEQLHAVKADTFVKLGAVSKAEQQLSGELAIAERELQHKSMLSDEAQQQIDRAEGRTALLANKVKKLHMRAKRAVNAKENAIPTFQMKEKGVYTNGARALARSLVINGVPVSKVNDIIHITGKTLGVGVTGDMSSQTVSRTILEGLVAANVQTVHEVIHAKG